MTDNRTEREKMLAGELYLAPDPELSRMQSEARIRLTRFNETPRTDIPARFAALEALLGKPTRAWIEAPFTVDFGVQVTLGKFCFVNMNCTFLDSNRITIGDSVAIGTGVQLITATHPVRFEERRIPFPQDQEFPMRAVCQALPITIGDGCWIGAGVIVLPGVTIGPRTVIGAGSVVTKSIPANCVAVGNPCRVMRYIDQPEEVA